jgi:polyribonucleotide nucleotidyltransferase
VAEPEVGEIYEGTVVKVVRLRRLRELLRPEGRPGPHLAAGAERVAKTSDVVKEGDKVWVKLLGFDERGKVRLSMKVVDQETGKEIVRSSACPAPASSIPKPVPGPVKRPRLIAPVSPPRLSASHLPHLSAS